VDIDIVIVVYKKSPKYHENTSETYSRRWASLKPGVLITVTTCVETNCQSNSLEPLDGWHRLAGHSSSEIQLFAVFDTLQQTVTSLATDVFTQANGLVYKHIGLILHIYNHS